MKKNINTILVPVQLDEEHLSVVKQAAVLAKEHGAELHLLEVIKTSFFFNYPMIPRLAPVKNFYEFNVDQRDMLDTWKKLIEQEFNIQVTLCVELGNWKKSILKYAKTNNVDLIILKEQAYEKKWYSFSRSPVEYIIKNCQCQVITLFSEKKSISEWKQIVIPITDFIPSARINTIKMLARLFKLKIHLLAPSKSREGKTKSGFHFLSETIKRLKQAGDIQIECKYLDKTGDPIHSFVEYTNSIGADALMTNMKKNWCDKNGFHKKITSFFSNTTYGSYPDAFFPVMN